MTKSTFINLDIDKPINWKFFIKHLYFSLIWIFGVLIIIFRGDFFLKELIPHNYEWIVRTIPLLYIVLILSIMINTKWYYNLSLILYPFLLILWFIPKSILKNGKIYLLFGYLYFIFNRITRLKSTIIHSSITMLAILLLIVTDLNIVTVCCMLYFTFLYHKIIVKYIKQSLQPIQLFGIEIEKALDEFIKKPEKSYSIIRGFEENKNDDKLSDEEKKIKRVERLIIANTLIEYLGINLNGFKSKRAFVISWIYQLLGFVFITLTYFTFINFELFMIENASFKTILEPTLFDFFYYTLKTFIFSNIDAILPVSIFARLIEILAFLTIGVFALIIVTSVIFSLKQDRLNMNIQKASEVCLSQNRFISEHIKRNYQMDITAVLAEAGAIKTSIENIKRTLEKLL